MAFRKCRSLGDLQPSFDEEEPSKLPCTPIRDTSETSCLQEPISASPDAFLLEDSQTFSLPYRPSRSSGDGRKAFSEANTGGGIQEDCLVKLNLRLLKARPSPLRKTPSYFDRRRKNVSSARGLNPLVSPDRFLPLRESEFEPQTQYRIGKSHKKLSLSEKQHRQRDSNADPFQIPTSARTVNNSTLLISRNLPNPRLSPRNRPRHIEEFSDMRREESASHSEDNSRQSNTAVVWSVGGFSPSLSSLTGGSPSQSFSRAPQPSPVYSARFDRKETVAEQYQMHKDRLALALDLDPASRILGFSVPRTPLDKSPNTPSPCQSRSPLTWKDDTWTRRDDYFQALPREPQKCKTSVVPIVPFRVLDAPALRDDFYATILAYCPTINVLAVGLSARVYLWSEQFGVDSPPLEPVSRHNHVTSLSFSSQKGGRSILAIGHRRGQVYLWSTFDKDVRFTKSFPVGIACVSFKSTPTLKSSDLLPRVSVYVEHLAVGDDAGNVWYYTVEWPNPKSRKRHNWKGCMNLIARIAAHTQQICAAIWSPDGKYFATGGNDNVCLLFVTDSILASGSGYNTPPIKKNDPNRDRLRMQRLDRVLSLHHGNDSTVSLLRGSARSNSQDSGTSGTDVSEISLAKTVVLRPNLERYRLKHYAAVKAIAFAPWEPALFATGGGSNDRSIRFWHAPTGALLATINVYAQVTSLVWSKTRRELAATFGYATPHHPYRIAVFSWPSCEQVLAIPWTTSDDLGGGSDKPGRALWAISYPGGPREMSAVIAQGPLTASGTSRGVNGRPNGIRESPSQTLTASSSRSHVADPESRALFSRTEKEGCIAIACSDESIRFQEVWGGEARTLGGCSGVFGGSQILESLHGLDTAIDFKEIIR